MIHGVFQSYADVPEQKVIDRLRLIIADLKWPVYERFWVPTDDLYVGVDPDNPNAPAPKLIIHPGTYWRLEIDQFSLKQDLGEYLALIVADTYKRLGLTP